MTKRVRIENADTSNYRVVVQIWERAYKDNGEPDRLVEEIMLAYPTAMTNENVYLTSSRYLVVKEAPPPAA